MVSTPIKHLKLSLKELPEGRTEIDLSCGAEEMGLTADVLRVNGNISGKLEIYRFGDRVDVKGYVSFRSLLTCSRCLRDYETDCTEAVMLYCIRGSEVSQRREAVLSEKDITTCYYEGETIDLTNSVRDTIILSTPLKPLCASDCRGLCPMCGKDLNRGRCQCNRETIDTRWDGLKKYKR